jgi:MATE family multidrug resistance protein
MESEPTGNWWTRACGGRDVLRIALPLVISTVSWTIMNFIDRMFLLWYSLPAFAAAMPAGMLHFTMICFPLGVASYVNTFVAQYHGAGRPERIGSAVWQAVRIGLFTAPLAIAVIPLAPYLFEMANHEPQVLWLEVTYFQTLTFGAGGTIIAAAMAAFFTGRGKTRVVMCVDSSAALVNIVLDALWIFGLAGFPEMGIEGAAWATVVSQWFKVLVYWRLMTRPEVSRTYALHAGRRYDGELMRRLWRFGGPNGLQLFVEIGAISIFILLMGGLGKEAMAATTLAFNVNSMAFVPVIGLGIAVSTIVGQQLGRDRPDLAARATYTTLLIALAYTGAMAVLYVSIPRVFLMGHATGVDAADFGSLSETVVVLLRFVAAYCLLDATAIVFVSAIKGAGDTRFILVTTFLTAPLPVIAALAGIRLAGWGLYWCWVVLTAWICLMGLIYMIRFLGGAWRAMRVIEPVVTELIAEEEPTAELIAEAATP